MELIDKLAWVLLEIVAGASAGYLVGWWLCGSSRAEPPPEPAESPDPLPPIQRPKRRIVV